MSPPPGRPRFPTPDSLPGSFAPSGRPGGAVVARGGSDGAVARRERAYRELVTSDDPVDQAIAAVYRNFLLQVEEVDRTGGSMLLAAGADGDPVVGRVAVFDDDRDILVLPWHAAQAQRQLTAPDRLLIGERHDGSLVLHRLTADAAALAARIRREMRRSAGEERMSDPLATLTREQGRAVEFISQAEGDVLLTGPPGSGKSAIAITELARRLLTHPDPARLRVLFVTGTPRLAHRAAALGRMLGIASIRPVPQADVLRHLGIGRTDTPVAGLGGAADGAAVPAAIERAFAELRERLAATARVPHPLGTVDADEVAAVRRCRAQAGTQPYAASAAALRSGLLTEYEHLLPGERSRERALAASEALRPSVTPTELVRRALSELRLPRSLRAAATACARTLLDAPPGRAAHAWDLLVVDEYQRLPAVVLWLLRRSAGTVLLSGDPRQAFTDADLGVGDVAAAAKVELTGSLRLPAAISAWIDQTWEAAGLVAPRIASAVEGGTVRSLERDEINARVRGSGGQVIATARDAARHDDWLDPHDALGLEWPEVILVDPAAILADHGEAGLFVAASRAIDTLSVVGATPAAGGRRQV